jgi:hypothetical protein
MPVQTNRYYNDPALGAAFSNLAGMFAPPSGGDLAGYATAAAKKEEAARLAELFNYAKDPAVQQEVFDRLGQATGQWTPAQGYYGVNVGAQTSRANNAADNTRMLQTNAADNERALRAAAMENQRSAITSLYGSLAPGEIAPAVPEDVAGLVGLPAIDQRAGLAKPLSETELKAAILGELPENEQRAAALGSTPVTNVVTPEGPRIQFQADAIGQEPYINKGAEAKPVNYQTPDGRRGTASVGPTGALVDTQTNQPVPEGSVTFGTNIQGSEADTGMSTKTNQTRAVQIRGDVTNMNGLVTELETLIRENPAVTGAAGNILSFAQDAKQVLNEFGQKFGNGDPNAPVSINDVRELTNSLLPETGPYNPVYRKAAAMVFELAYANAKLNNPGGEVSRFALERELEQLGQGMTGNDEALKAVLDVSKSRMRRALSQADVLAGNSAGVTADQIGSAPAPAPAGGSTRIRFDANGNQIQ